MYIYISLNNINKYKYKCVYIPEKGRAKASSDNENPCAQQIAACKTFNIEILQLQRSPNCTENFEADIPVAANFLHVTPSKLEFFCWNNPVSTTTESIKLLAQNVFKIGVLQLQQTLKHHDCT